MTPKFLRRGWSRYSKLGLRRKKKQVWRRPHGRDNKMREKRGGYPAVVSIGYKKEKEAREKINGKNMAMVNNLNDLLKIKKDEIAVIGKIGKRKKIEIAKRIKENSIPVYNLNVNKLLKSTEKKQK